MTAIKEKFTINNETQPEVEGYRLFVKCYGCKKEAKFFSNHQANEQGWRILRKKEGIWRCPNCRFKVCSIYIPLVNLEFIEDVLIDLFAVHGNFSSFVRESIENQLKKERKKIKNLLLMNHLLGKTNNELKSLPDYESITDFERLIFKNVGK